MTSLAISLRINHMEQDDYLLEQCQLQHIDPLQYWSNKCMHLPSLAKAAQYHLSIPAFSAPVERLFSVAGNFSITEIKLKRLHVSKVDVYLG